ncbi:50S ribosomal protein L7 [Caryophanon latum]|uniref:50S ribosomal protein L7 n=2 Tax=Caryophanon latum TaxID=33977 RepID=A0A1C0YYV0_9BACL|nr:50S ribosomal protein L7 [Caryophanon latum]
MMTPQQQIIQMLGLAARARKIITGEELVVTAVRNGSAKLVFLADDASKNSNKKIQDKCTYYKVPYAIFGDRYTLGQATGKEARVTVAITDAGFAKKLKSLIAQINEA